MDNGDSGRITYFPLVAEAGEDVVSLGRQLSGQDDPSRFVVELRLCSLILGHGRLQPDRRRGNAELIAYLARGLGTRTPSEMWAVVAHHFPVVERRPGADVLLAEVAAIDDSDLENVALVEDGKRLVRRIARFSYETGAP